MNAARFWRHVDTSAGLFGCWPWRGCCTEDGYGQARVNGRTQYAHRVAWEAWHGQQLPTGAVLRHLCNQADCCNPAHLVPGTQADNVADRVAAGHNATGERNGRAKLDSAAVAMIRRWWGRGLATKAECARMFRVSERAIRYVVNGEHWRTA